MSGKVNIKRLIAPAYYEVHRDIQQRKHSVYRFKGGRGSLKTSTIIIEILLLMQQHPELCAAVFMKQSNRLRQGAFAAFTEMIQRAGLESLYRVSYSPMRITNKSTGQIIAFFGLDDPNKTKGLNTGRADNYFGIVYFNEITDFAGNREIDTAIDSLVRGGPLSWCFQDYNPPRSASAWVNKDSLLDLPERVVHSSDYRMVPREWLGDAFLEKVRACYQRNPKEYRWRYLGEIIGVDGLVFQNIKQWDFDINKKYDMIFMGCDLGWSDPLTVVRIGYIIDTQELYILDEFYERKKQNEDAADFIVRNGYTDARLIIESARGEGVLPAFTSRGIPCSLVNKGNNLRMNAVYFLASRKGIYIDPHRTPNAWSEFNLYEWAKDSNGDILSPETLVDGNDHTIDAARYAISTHIGFLEAL